MSLALYYAGLPLTIALSLIALVALWIGLAPLLQRRRRRYLWRRPFPSAWDRILSQELPGLRRLPPDLLRQLKAHLQQMLLPRRRMLNH